MTYTGVQTNLQEQNGIKNCAHFSRDSFNLSNPQLRSHLIYESKNKLSLYKVNDEKKEIPHFHFASLTSGRRRRVPFRLCLIYYCNSTFKIYIPFYSNIINNKEMG